MKLNEIVGILNNKITALETAKGIAYGQGALEEYARLDSEIGDTKQTLGALVSE